MCRSWAIYQDQKPSQIMFSAQRCHAHTPLALQAAWQRSGVAVIRVNTGVDNFNTGVGYIWATWGGTRVHVQAHPRGGGEGLRGAYSTLY